MDILLKSKLIDYLYSAIDVSKYKYEILEKQQDVKKFLLTSYYLSGNFVGDNCFLIFIKLKNDFYSFIVNRKTITFSKPKSLDKVEISLVSVKSDLTIYNGTIFDGNYVRQPNGNHSFVITDMCMFKGNDCNDMTIDVKLHRAREYVEKFVTMETIAKPNTIPLKITVNKLYDLTYLDKYVTQISSQNNEWKIRGLSFYPEISGTKLLFMFSSKKSNTTSTGTKTIEQRQAPLPTIMQNTTKSDNTKETKYIMVNNTNDDLYAILNMEQFTSPDKTIVPDVYQLFALKRDETKEFNGKTVYKKVSMDKAYIANATKSKWCKEIFKNGKKSVLVKCIFNDDKHKWEPLELETSHKLPSFYDQIEIDILEEDN